MTFSITVRVSYRTTAAAPVRATPVLHVTTCTAAPVLDVTTCVCTCMCVCVCVDYM